MDLTPAHRDALTELINIGYGRAAGSLSELTGYRIMLEVPRVDIHDAEAIAPMLASVITSNAAGVEQPFSGPIAGSALLVLSEESALVLSQLLMEDTRKSATLDKGARETITELGNILLNACIGVFGNLLEVPLIFAVPRLQVDSVSRIVAPIERGPNRTSRYGLMVHTRFSLKTGQVSGYLVIILGVESMDRLLLELEHWEKRQAV